MRLRDVYRLLRRRGRPLEGINGWTATITSPTVGLITFIGTNESSARIRAENHLRLLDRDPDDFFIDVKPPEPPNYA